MRPRTVLLAALALVLLAAPAAFAQTTDRKVTWTQPLTAGQVAGDYAAPGTTYALKIDTANPIALTQTCTGTVSPLACTAPIASSQLPTAAGPHRYELIVSNAVSSASFVQTAGSVAAPGGFTITITISVPGGE